VLDIAILFFTSLWDRVILSLSCHYNTQEIEFDFTSAEQSFYFNGKRRKKEFNAIINTNIIICSFPFTITPLAQHQLYKISRYYYANPASYLIKRKKLTIMKLFKNKLFILFFLSYTT